MSNPLRHKPDTPKIPPKEQFNIISQVYLGNIQARHKYCEMEAKFGTRGIKPITKTDYDNVVKKLKSAGYVPDNQQGNVVLKIQPVTMDASGQYKTSYDFDKFRVEIKGITNIQEYCRTNDLKAVDDLSTYSVSIARKNGIKSSDTGTLIESADFDDFNFRVTIMMEESVGKKGQTGSEMFVQWNRTKKVFRYLNRVSFTHGLLPFRIDMSIVRSSTKDARKKMIPTYNIEESNVFQNPETYEIEIEVLEDAKIKYKDKDKFKPEQLVADMQKVIKLVLSGLQQTNFPVSYYEQRETLNKYHQMLFEDEFKQKGEPYVPNNRLYPSDFIGPSLVTLELQNIAPLDSNVIVPNITKPFAYCVTDKADGDRHMLFVNNSGKIYLISTNMNVIFTGAITKEPRCFNSLLDGELILHDKYGQFINTFAAFDIYYVQNIDVRARPFIKTEIKDDKYFADGCRLPMLKDFIKLLNAENILLKHVDESTPQKKYDPMYRVPIHIISKQFYPLFDTKTSGETATTKYSIFDASHYLLSRISDGLFEYEIDGLIFTPTLLGVGSNTFSEAGPKKKITWQHCFKWKPSTKTSTFPKSYNTIDFLVLTKKGADGLDVVTPIFEKGVNVYESTQFNQYKTLILAVGFDQLKHGYINPCQDVLDDKFSNQKDIDEETGYKPKQFYPTDPYDPLAGLCNVMLEMDSIGKYQMFTEERETFEDQTVVEFRYDITKPGLWKWIPMRVRHDKTADFRAKHGVGANDYNTANSNWKSIHNPVTETMIATGNDIPGIEVSDDVYYNSITTDKLTKGMRDFHNLYVKKMLIQAVSRRGNILIDFACGKAGDLPKWIAAELSFVFGIDISKDNIENRLNGACSRYLNFKKTTKNVPYALFVNGNSALNIRSGTNMFNDKANEITKAIFGASTSVKSLGPAVERQSGKGHSGFDVSSCQFAMHYMFENKRTFYQFIRNVAECTKLNGYFIATCYDGLSVFNMLKKKAIGESEEIYVDDTKIWGITKLYDNSTFEDNESCLGYKIDVYQDSINQTLTEYLVNFDFLTSTMDKYGFSLVSRGDARHMGLPEGSGLFSELFHSMMNQVEKNPEKATDYKDALHMEHFEKRISFLNRFFVYKKIATRNAETLTNTLLGQLPDEVSLEQAGTMLAREAVKEAEMLIKPKAKNLREQLKLQEATEAFEEPQPQTKKKRQGEKKKGTRKIKESVDIEVVDDV